LNNSVTRWVGGTALALALGCIAYWLLFTQFMIYDDEGYVLWSLRNYVEVGGLYERVFSQYGPFFYTYYHWLHVSTGLTFDNDNGRLLTLFYWCTTALVCGWITWRQTKAPLAAAAASALTFASLNLMTSEPLHPGGLLTWITGIATAAAALAIEKNHHRKFACIVGLAGAAMALTKINVGAFFLIPAGCWLAINAERPALVRPALWLVALGCVSTPFFLMRPHWPAVWVTTYALIFSCGALALVSSLHRARAPLHGLKSWVVFAVAGAIVVVVTTAATWSRGTSLSALIDGTIIAPLRHPGVYAFLGTWQPGTREAAAAFALLAVAYHFFREAKWTPWIIVALRVVAAAIYFTRAASANDGWLHRFGFDYGPSLAALMAVPLQRGEFTPLNRARLWLAWIFVWQTLQGYPVAGTQTSWGSFLWAPLCVCAWHEAAVYCREYFPRRARIIAMASGAALGAATLLALVPLGRLGYARYQPGEALDLPGARRLRLREDFTSTFRILRENIRAHGEVLFSDPGMFSFNIWTERPTPTEANVTHWFSLLSEAQQQAIIAKLDGDPRALIMVNRFLFNYLVENGYPPRGSLQLYIATHFQPSLRLDTYELWTRRGRLIAPLSTAQISPVAGAGAPAHYRLQFVLDANPRSVHRAELRQLYPPYAVLQTLPVDQSQPWQATPITLANEIAGPTETLTAPFALSRPSRIATEFELKKDLPLLGGIEVFLLDEQGGKIAALRFSK
jgi:hypothetical protein